jgi:hypothetical protein
MRILFSKCCMLFVIMLTLGLVPLVGNSSVVNATSYSDWDYSPVTINVYTVSGDVYNRVEPDSPISSEANFILTGSTNTVQIDVYHNLDVLPSDASRVIKLYNNNEEISATIVEDGTDEHGLHRRHYSFRVTDADYATHPDHLFLKVGMPSAYYIEHEVHYIGAIPAGKGLLKLKLDANKNINYPIIESSYLETDGSSVLPMNNLFTNFVFYELNQGVWHGNFDIESYYSDYNKKIPINDTVIEAGKVNNLTYYSTKDVHFKLLGSPTDELANKEFEIYNLDDYENDGDWYFFDSQIVTTDLSGEVVLENLPVGNYWIIVKDGYDANEDYYYNPKINFSFGVKFSNEVSNESTKNQVVALVFKKSSPGEFDVSDLVNIAKQASSGDPVEQAFVKFISEKKIGNRFIKEDLRLKLEQ